MNVIQSAVQSFLPSKRKTTPSGWISFNAVCCHHNGDQRDTRKRGGVLINNDSFQYHCFNCGFKAGWSPGRPLSKNTRNLFQWLGMPTDEINKLILDALRSKDEQVTAKPIVKFELATRPLPNDCRMILDLLENNPTDEVIAVVDYLANRGMDLEWYDWMWTSENGYKDRVIIPFYQEGKIVGFTGRKIKPGKPKYLTDSQNGYVFNIDRQHDSRDTVIVVEGQFDAIAIDGVAIMTNEPSATQIARINQLGKKIIAVPDRDKPGAKLIQAALDNGWAVSLPPWEDDVKDAAEAVQRYGRLYTLFTILHYQETGEIKIQLLKKKLENIHDNE
jgi:hypothetical protein